MILKTAISYAQYGEGDIVLNKSSSFRSLSVQLLAGVLLSLMIAALAFGVFFFLGSSLLDHTVYGEAFSDRMADRQFRHLQEYVTQENISTEKLYRLNAWCSRGNGVYLTVYRDERLIYESPVSRYQTFDPDSFDLQAEKTEREYALTFADGVEAQAFMYYFASDAFYIWMTGISGLLAFAVFSLCFVSLVHRKLRYIQRIKKELDILAGGDLSYSVTVQGQDELSELAAGIDEMRRSILKHQQAEEEIRSANSRLVTAMSHDLRTPLTSLLAFLEILDRDKAKDEEQRRHLIRQSLTQTMSIKAMADKLFEYFLVYTSEWEEPELEHREADEVFSQFWQEYAFALESHGFVVETDFGELRGFIEVNLELLRRVFDNIYANLVKYAEPLKPIRIAYGRDNGQILLTITNTISSLRDRKESTNIGLNTCRRIMRMLGGSFEANESEQFFTVELRLPFTNGKEIAGHVTKQYCFTDENNTER